MERFPALDLTWDAPERITNAIVDVNLRSSHDYKKIFSELDDLGCKALELRLFYDCKIQVIRKILECTSHGRLRSISLLTGYRKELDSRKLEKLCAEHPRLRAIVIHSSPEARMVDLPGAGITAHYRREVIDSPQCCGQIHPGYFVASLGVFSEAQRHNTCLNRKISIDAESFIRNCPSLPAIYGNSNEVSLHSAVARRDFSKLWLINKDRIEICRDCEFRYICTDCRAFISNSSDIFSKPSRCTYDPYTARWQGKSG